MIKFKKFFALTVAVLLLTMYIAPCRVTAAGTETEIINFLYYNVYDENSFRWNMTSLSCYKDTVPRYVPTGGVPWAGYSGREGNYSHSAEFNSNNGTWGQEKGTLNGNICGADFIGTKYSRSWYNTNTCDFEPYKNNGVLTLKITFSETTPQEYLDYIYFAIMDYTSNQYHMAGIKLTDFYSADDIGSQKQVFIPISDFEKSGTTRYSTDGSNSIPKFTNINAVGLMFDNIDKIQGEGSPSFKYTISDMYLCSVEAPTNLTLVDSDNARAELKWDASLSEVAYYRVIRNDGKTFDTDANATSYIDTTMEAGETYTYRVAAVDKHGVMSSMSNSVEVYAAPIGAPQNLAAVSSFDDEVKVRLTWENPKYGTVGAFDIYRDDEKIASVNGNVNEYYDNANLSEDVFYTYYIRAVTSEGVSSMPSERRKVLAAFIGYPENVKTELADNKIILSWDKVNSAESYIIFRNNVRIAEVSGNETEYTDSDCDYSTAYTYFLQAVNKAGKVSRSSEHVIALIEETNKTARVIFDDAVSEGYGASGVGSGKLNITTDKAAKGNRSGMLTFAAGSFESEGIAFSPVSPLNLTDARLAGERLEFYIYAENADMLDKVKVGFECTTEPLSNQTYTARSGVGISDYVTQYGYWNYVSIPIAEFPNTGIYAADISSNRYCKFKFNSVKGIAFYIDEPQYLTDKTIYIDDIKFVRFSQPGIVNVTLSDGTEVLSGTEISASSKELNITFDTDIDANSLEGNVLLVSEAGNLPVDCSYNANTKTVKVLFTTGLQKMTSYSLKFDGVKPLKGASIVGAAFDFSTNGDEPETVPAMADVEYVKIDARSAKKGDAFSVKLNLESDAAKKAVIDAMDITISYETSTLRAVENDIRLSSSLKDAKVDVDTNSGKITIKTDGASNTYVIGSYIADIAFEALRAGGSDITVSGTLSQTSPPKSVKVEQKGSPKISITASSDGGTGSGGSGGSGGGGFGGGRSEATVGNNANVAVTDLEQTDVIDNLKFKDSKEISWAAEAIEFLGKNNIINGYEDGTFKPDLEVTREEFAAMLIRAFSQIDENAEAEFLDADKNEWYYPAVSTAAALGIVNGYDGKFGIGDKISRQDMCAMLSRTAEVCGISLYPQYNTAIFYDETEIADYAKESIRLLQTAGIVNGVGDNRFEPNEKVTRAMAAKVIYELYKLR